MNAPLTSPSFPNGIPAIGSESDVRELARAKLKAKEARDVFCAQRSKGFSEDEIIDREIEGIRLCRALNDADYALHCAVSP